MNLNILLIEDNPGDAFLIKFYLEESVLKFARLLHAEYLKTAIDLLQNNEFDVVLLDLNLPDSKGIQTLEDVLAACKGSVVIVLTGLNDEQLGLETVKKGAQDFLIKGQFDGKVLTSSVRYAFERYQLQKQVVQCSVQLSENVAQFEIAQKVGEFGYWELNAEDQSMYWSSNLPELLGQQAPNDGPSLPALLKLLPGSAAQNVEEHITKALKANGNVDVAFDVNGQKFVCRAQPSKSNGTVHQLAGIIQRA